MKLYLKNGPNAGNSWELKAPGINIGRENDNDIQLPIGGVSRYHAKISPLPDGKWQIQDLGSTNGTKINGSLLSAPAILREGDIIQVGEQQLEVGTAPVQLPPLQAVHMQMPPQSAIPPEGPASHPRATPPPQEKNVSRLSPGTLGDIFGKGSGNGSPSAGNTPENKKKKAMSNLVFAVLVIALAAIALAIFMKINEPKKLPAAKPKAPVISNAFCAVYEKQEIRDGAIFRFAMTLEGNKVVFSVDEHKAKDKISYQYASSPSTVQEETLKKLQKALKNTSFMKLKQEPYTPASRGNDLSLRITLAQGNDTNTITVRNSYPQKSFSETAAILESFIEEVSGIRTVSMSVEEMRREAEKNFRIAQDLFDNYQAKPQNLRESIARFQFTVTLLERFQPRPPMWQEAKEKAASAKEILNKILKTTHSDMMIQYRLKNHAGSLEKAKILLDYMSPDSKNYEKIRSLKIELERDLAKIKRRK